MKKLYSIGPWQPGQNNSVCDKNGFPILLILGSRKPLDAKLVIKAPEMADAIEAALPYLKQCNISGSHVVAEEIEKIIKTIEGE